MLNVNKNKFTRLSRIVSHALRHEPWIYELELDEEGWIAVDSFLSSISEKSEEWKGTSESDLYEMIEVSEKKRHEIQHGKIRAIYGHSLVGKLVKEVADPPEYLYHGTTPKVIEKIKSDGLLPMNRQYVHLSIGIDTAKQVGQRKSSQPIILRVRAKQAYQNNICFYRCNNLVWLADRISANFIDFS